MEAQTLKGFRDIPPEEALKRGRVLSLLKSVFKSYGFFPLETPTLEYADLVEKEVGEEMQKMIFKFQDQGGRWVALRAEHTPSLARYITQNFGKLIFPFKRYQIGNIFRAEKPQAGRYREFTQVDIDTVGVDTALADAEIIAVVATALQLLGLKKFKIVINDRTLFGDLPAKAIRILDKMDKIGKEKVGEELEQGGFKDLEILKSIANQRPTPRLEEVFSLLASFGIPKDFYKFDPFLARGLDYYTSTVFEVKVEGVGGSLGGGGRYDNMVENLLGKKVPAVGIAFGLDRLVEIVPKETFSDIPFRPRVLVTVFSPELLDRSIRLFDQVQGQGIETELYLDPNAKLDKQLKYADKKGIQFAVILGPQELKNREITLKDLRSGLQKTVSQELLLSLLTEKRA